MSTKLVSQVVVGIVSECHLKGVMQKRHLNSEGLCMSCMMHCFYFQRPRYVVLPVTPPAHIVVDR